MARIEKKPRALKLPARQRFRPPAKAAAPRAPSEERLEASVPAQVAPDADELALFREVEARLAAAAPPRLEAEIEVFRAREARENPAADPEIAAAYARVGELLHVYRSGKLPKAFQLLPLLPNWRALIELTEPTRWTPHAIYEAVKLFTAAHESDRMVEFYEHFLLPRVLLDIAQSKELNYHLFRALGKALYRPASFFQGILLPLMDTRTATLRQANVVLAAFARKSVPSAYVAAAILRASEKPYNPANAAVMRALVNKKSALPAAAVSRLCEWFLAAGGSGEERMPLVWHQTLLAFARCYGAHISAAERKRLSALARKKFCHEAIAPEIVAALNEQPTPETI